MPCNAVKSGLALKKAAGFFCEPDYVLSRHMTLEFYGCETPIIADPRKLEIVMINAAKFSGATVIGSSFHGFAPQGVSGFVIIAESHFSVHSWPEHEYAAVDIFTCGGSIDFQKAIDFLRQGFQAREAFVSADMRRGLACPAGTATLIPEGLESRDCYTLSWKEKFEKSRAAGILISLDLHRCARENHGGARLRKQLRSFAERLGWTPAGGTARLSVLSESCVAVSLNCQCGGLNVRFDAESLSAFIEITSPSFCEPRIAAEAAMSLFGAENYRMNVVLRR